MIEIITKTYYTNAVDVKNTVLNKYYIGDLIKEKTSDEIKNNPQDIYIVDVPTSFQFFTLNGECFIYLDFIKCVLLPSTSKITVDDIIKTRINLSSWTIEKSDKVLNKKTLTENLINSLKILWFNSDTTSKLSSFGIVGLYKGFLLVKNLNTGESIECYCSIGEYGYVHIAFENMTFPINLSIYDYKRMFIENIIEWMIV